MWLMKRAIIIHGWTGSPEENWFRWLGKELKKLDYRVDIPLMPNSDYPNLSEWLSTLKSLSPDDNTLIIGHSLANALIMRYLAEDNSKAKGAVMVAAWNWLVVDLKEYHQTFFETNFDYESIKKKKLPIIIVNSTNDPYIDFERSKNLATKLGSKFISIKDAGHFNKSAGYTKFPKLVEIITQEFS